ncbi:MAG TPA: AI-2E family transporter [Terriglobales bacterium]|nr:AI-2E family transporter [Terriglobales bacterium]
MATDEIDLEERGEAVLPAAPAPPRRRRGDHVSSAAQTVVAIAVVLTLCYVAKLVVITLMVSILLAFLLQPVVEMLERLRMPRSLASFLAVVFLLGIAYGGTHFSYNRAVDFVQQWPKYSVRVRQVVTSFRERTLTIQKTTERVLAQEPERGVVTVQQKVDWAEVLTRSAASVWEFVLIVSFIPFLVYFMLSWQDHVKSATVMLFRLENRNAAYKTLSRISAMTRSFIVGNLLIGLFMAAISVIVFALVDLSYPFILGFLSGFLSLVPYLGVVLAVVPPLVAGLGELSGGKLLVVVVTVLILHLFAINVLYPKILGRRLQLNPLVVTIALLVWGWIWGGMGLILAVPITGAMKIIFDHVETLRPYGAWMGE